MQIDLHLLGDEEAEVQDRTQRVLDIVERSTDAAARQFRQIGHRARRLQRAQHIGRRLGIECIGVEKVRAGEHVEHGRPRRRQIGLRPGADLRKLALLELRERGIEEFCVALPGRIPGQRRQRRVRRRHHAGEEFRGIVRRCRVGGATRRRGREQAGGSKHRNSHRLHHVSFATRRCGRGTRLPACGKPRKSKVLKA